MTKTMIQIQKQTRDKIKSLGVMGETYDDVILRLYDQAIENQLAKKLLSTEGYVLLDDVLKKRGLLK